MSRRLSDRAEKVVSFLEDYMLWPIESVCLWVFDWILRPAFTGLAAGARALGKSSLLLLVPVVAAAVWVWEEVLQRVFSRLGRGVLWILEKLLGKAPDVRFSEAAPALLTALVCLTVFTGYYMRCVQDLTAPEAIELAQTARNVSEAHGFTTDAIRPLSLLFHNKVAGHPDFYVSPLQTAVTAVAFVLQHPSDRVAADRAADIATAEMQTSAESGRDKLIRYRMGVKADLGPNSEGAATLPRLTARHSSSSSSSIVGPNMS